MVDRGRDDVAAAAAALSSSVRACSTFSMSDMDTECVCRVAGCAPGDVAAAAAAPAVSGWTAGVERVPLACTVVDVSATRRDDVVASGAARTSVTSAVSAIRAPPPPPPRSEPDEVAAEIG